MNIEQLLTQVGNPETSQEATAQLRQLTKSDNPQVANLAKQAVQTITEQIIPLIQNNEITVHEAAKVISQLPTEKVQQSQVTSDGLRVTSSKLTTAQELILSLPVQKAQEVVKQMVVVIKENLEEDQRPTTYDQRPQELISNPIIIISDLKNTKPNNGNIVVINTAAKAEEEITQQVINLAEEFSDNKQLNVEQLKTPETISKLPQSIFVKAIHKAQPSVIANLIVESEPKVSKEIFARLQETLTPQRVNQIKEEINQVIQTKNFNPQQAAEVLSRTGIPIGVVPIAPESRAQIIDKTQPVKQQTATAASYIGDEELNALINDPEFAKILNELEKSSGRKLTNMEKLSVKIKYLSQKLLLSQATDYRQQTKDVGDLRLRIEHKISEIKKEFFTLINLLPVKEKEGLQKGIKGSRDQGDNGNIEETIELFEKLLKQPSISNNRFVKRNIEETIDNFRTLVRSKEIHEIANKILKEAENGADIKKIELLLIKKPALMKDILFDIEHDLSSNGFFVKKDGLKSSAKLLMILFLLEEKNGHDIQVRDELNKLINLIIRRTAEIIRNSQNGKLEEFTKLLNPSLLEKILAMMPSEAAEKIRRLRISNNDSRFTPCLPAGRIHDSRDPKDETKPRYDASSVFFKLKKEKDKSGVLT
jgi:hypothetical protein